MDTGHNRPLATGRGKARVIARWSCQCQPGFSPAPDASKLSCKPVAGPLQISRHQSRYQGNPDNPRCAEFVPSGFAVDGRSRRSLMYSISPDRPRLCAEFTSGSSSVTSSGSDCDSSSWRKSNAGESSPKCVSFTRADGDDSGSTSGSAFETDGLRGTHVSAGRAQLPSLTRTTSIPQSDNASRASRRTRLSQSLKACFSAATISGTAQSGCSLI